MIFFLGILFIVYIYPYHGILYSVKCTLSIAYTTYCGILESALYIIPVSEFCALLLGQNMINSILVRIFENKFIDLKIYTTIYYLWKPKVSQACSFIF